MFHVVTISIEDGGERVSFASQPLYPLPPTSEKICRYEL